MKNIFILGGERLAMCARAAASVRGPVAAERRRPPPPPPPLLLTPFALFSSLPFFPAGLRPSLLWKHVRQTRILSAGAEQDRVGGSGAVPEPDAGGLRSLRFGLVSVCAHRNTQGEAAAHYYTGHNAPTRQLHSCWLAGCL